MWYLILGLCVYAVVSTAVTFLIGRRVRRVAHQQTVHATRLDRHGSGIVKLTKTTQQIKGWSDDWQKTRVLPAADWTWRP
jgi:hypothetical protein